MMGNTMFSNMPMQGMGNNMMNNQATNPAGMISNNGMFQNNGMHVQNLNNLYPCIYRIINPVVARVVSNNTQAITEDLINNMTDTVFNIVEGQIDLGDDISQRNSQAENSSSSNSSSSTSSNNNTSARANERQTTSQTTFKNNRNESLLRDLIKIIIIKELLSRNQMQRQFMQNPFYNSQPFYMNM